MKLAALALLLVLPCAAGEVAAKPTEGASPPAQSPTLPQALHGTPGPELAGLAIVVADPTRVLRAEAYGQAVLDPTRSRALTPDTPVRVASISKLVVALTAWKLIEQHRLAPDADVSTYLHFPLRNPAHPDIPITLRQLLSHTSGIDDGPGYSFPPSATLQASLTPQHWSQSAPGVRFSYANLNYGIVATILEAVTHTRFDRLARATILAPLHLDACYNWSGCSPQAVAQAAVLYRKGKDETAWSPSGPWLPQIDDLHGVVPACPVRGQPTCDLTRYIPGTNGTLFSPQGGLRISALGLATIGRLILNRGEVDGIRLLQPATVDAMLTPVWRDTGQPSGDTYQGLMRLYASGPAAPFGRTRPARPTRPRPRPRLGGPSRRSLRPLGRPLDRPRREPRLRLPHHRTRGRPRQIPRPPERLQRGRGSRADRSGRRRSPALIEEF